VKDLNEYNESVSEAELFSFLYDRIISREIIVFSDLLKFAAPLLKDKRTYPSILRAFELIKKLNWGFFAQMSPVTHKRLWKELVIPDPKFPEAGDLKRTLSISNLYVVMMDIHGYTKFCQESRKNLSMLHILDRAINNEIREISSKCQAVSQRERGDEIVVVAASATDALTAAVAIMDYFNKTNMVNDPNIPVYRTGDAAFLPVFKLSAGITGGNTSSPLIITEQGALSGFLLNSGARLQTRANELSSKDNRIMVTKQVQMSYMKENSDSEKCSLYRHDAVYFLDTGLIEFKGVMLPTCEAVFNAEERYKEKFSDALVTLFNTIKENNWEQKIFSDLLELLIKVSWAMPPFHVADRGASDGSGEHTYVLVRGADTTGKTITNNIFVQLCQMALKAYIITEDYAAAIAQLKNLLSIMEQIPQFDRLVMDYAKAIAEKYDLLLRNYEVTIEKEIDEKAGLIFSGNYLKTYFASKNAITIFEKLKAAGHKSPELTKKKTLWYTLIKANQGRLNLTLHSGKK
jgi:hypothetical protein